MNWDKVEEIIRRHWPEAPQGIGEVIRDEYRGKPNEVEETNLTVSQEKIIREAFIKESKDKPNARDHARAFVTWAIGQGWEFQVSERFRNAGRIESIVDRYWQDNDEEEVIHTQPDPRIRVIFNRLTWWTRRDKLAFIRNHDPKKLTWYAYLVWDARPEIIERQDEYVSVRGILKTGYHPAQAGFDMMMRTSHLDDIRFWEAVSNGYKGWPRKKPTR